MKKREEAAAEEAKIAIQEFESLSKQLNNSETENIDTETNSGRRTFGSMKKSAPEPRKKTKSEYYGDTDDEDDTEAREAVEYDGDNNKSSLFADANIDSDILCEDSKTHQNSVFKVGMFHEYLFSLVYFFVLLLNNHSFPLLLVQSFDETVRDPGPKTTHEVAIFASGTWKKVKVSFFHCVPDHLC